MKDIPRCCPLCLGRLLYQKPPPGALAAGCKDCAALVLVFAPYPMLARRCA